MATPGAGHSNVAADSVLRRFAFAAASRWLMTAPLSCFASAVVWECHVCSLAPARARLAPLAAQSAPTPLKADPRVRAADAAPRAARLCWWRARAGRAAYGTRASPSPSSHPTARARRAQFRFPRFSHWCLHVRHAPEGSPACQKRRTISGCEEIRLKKPCDLPMTQMQ